jgi:hypothetical protein
MVSLGFRRLVVMKKLIRILRGQSKLEPLCGQLFIEQEALVHKRVGEAQVIPLRANTDGVVQFEYKYLCLTSLAVLRFGSITGYYLAALQAARPP